jgi:hypothetical protein
MKYGVILGPKVHKLLLKKCQRYLASLIDAYRNYEYRMIPEWVKGFFNIFPNDVDQTTSALRSRTYGESGTRHGTPPKNPLAHADNRVQVIRRITEEASLERLYLARASSYRAQ